jgi:hypothetical protein
MKNTKKLIFALIAIFFIASLLIPFATLFADGTGTITTKKDDYKPDSNVMIFGDGFCPETTYVIEVTGPDNEYINTVPADICTNKNGDFKYKFELEDISEDFNPVGTYTVTLYDKSGNTVATTQFTDGTVRW